MKINVWKNRKPIAWFVRYYFKNVKDAEKRILALQAEEEAREAAGDPEGADRLRAEEKEAIGQAYYRFCKEACDWEGIRIHVTGLENLPPEDQPVVYIANHQAYADVFAYGYALGGRQISFIAKAELSKVPLYGAALEKMRTIYIPADDIRSHVAVINKGADYLKKGFNMAIFPEGKRSWGKEMGEFKKGSFQLACRAGVPIVPVAIEGTYNTYEAQKVIAPADVYFSVLPPVETAGVPKKDWNSLAEQVEALIKKEVQRLQK